MGYNGKHSGATIDVTIDKVLDGSAVSDFTLHEVLNDDTFPVTGAAILNNFYTKSEAEEMFESKAGGDMWYGVKLPGGKVIRPSLTRIGNMELHRKLPIQSRMRGCLLRNDGTVEEYLPIDDWTGFYRLDGYRGQVMVEIPEHYRRFDLVNDQWQVMLSEVPLQGFKRVPQMYISAYEASIYRPTGILCSAKSESADFRGGDNTAEWDGTYRSLLGMPVTNMTIGELRSAAMKRGFGWSIFSHDAYMALVWLYVVEYANTDIQASIRDDSAEGYKQGGLGTGVTEFSNWYAHNLKNPIVPCGVTDELGNGSGAVWYPVPLSNGGVSNVMVPRYRGIENPFGHIWKYIDGIFVRDRLDSSLGYLTDVFKNYVAPSYFGDLDHYEPTEIPVPTEAGYIAEIDPVLLVPKTLGGNSATGYCDAYAIFNRQSGDIAINVGGYAESGLDAGLFNQYLFYAMDGTVGIKSVGTRLTYVNEEKYF